MYGERRGEKCKSKSKITWMENGSERMWMRGVWGGCGVSGEGRGLYDVVGIR